MLTHITIDIETIDHQIACIGIGVSESRAICIPIFTSKNYWEEKDEIEIVSKIKYLLEGKGIVSVFQNGLYDCQYLSFFWGIKPWAVADTMIAHHVCFAGLRKSLDFMASLYCNNYVYWKDELKNYKDAPADDTQFFNYNCDDCTYTFEIWEILHPLLKSIGLTSIYSNQMDTWQLAFSMMLRGVKIDKKKRTQFALSLWETMAERQKYLDTAVGYHLNPKSPKQLQNFFYNEMAMRPIKSRISGNLTTDDGALRKISQRDLLLKPICDVISDLRTLGVYYSTFIQSDISSDGRMRCSYNPAGTTTYRFSSSENAFGQGMNLQNIPGEDKDRKKKEIKKQFVMPNVREIFIPDPGYVLTEWDLERADLQVVVWEANDALLKEAIRRGIDIHMLNASTIFGFHIPLDEMIETNSKYEKHRSKMEKERYMMKQWVHGTNYAGSPSTMSRNCNISFADAVKFRNLWFEKHPGILNWHHRIQEDLNNTKTVKNKFGYQRFFFDRAEEILPEALAWIPQSTVALVINKGLVNVQCLTEWGDRGLKVEDVQVLMQVHDSGVIQIKEYLFPNILPTIKARLSIPILYTPEPLTIPVGCKASRESWGKAVSIKV